MDANQLLHYLRGFFELVPDPSPAQLTAVRNEVLRATTVDTFQLPRSMPTGDCGCSGKSSRPPPPPSIDPSKM